MIRMHTCVFLSLWWAPGAWIYAERKKKKGEKMTKMRQKKNPVWAKQQKSNEQHQQQQIHLK